MTAKEYLGQARHLDTLINCRLRELDYWRDLSSSVSGSNFEAHYNPNRPTEAPFVRCIAKIDEIEHEIAAKVSYLVGLREEISWKAGRNNCYSVTATWIISVGRKSAECFVFPVAPYTAYMGRRFKIFLCRNKCWHTLAQNGTLDLCYNYNGEREYRTAFVGAILRGLFLCPETEVNQCQADPNDRVLTPAVPTLRMDSTVSNTQP